MALVFHADGTVTEAVKVKHWLAPSELVYPDPLMGWWAYLDRDEGWTEDNVTDTQ